MYGGHVTCLAWALRLHCHHKEGLAVARLDVLSDHHLQQDTVLPHAQ